MTVRKTTRKRKIRKFSKVSEFFNRGQNFFETEPDFIRARNLQQFQPMLPQHVFLPPYPRHRHVQHAQTSGLVFETSPSKTFYPITSGSSVISTPSYDEGEDVFQKWYHESFARNSEEEQQRLRSSYPIKNVLNYKFGGIQNEQPIYQKFVKFLQMDTVTEQLLDRIINEKYDTWPNFIEQNAIDYAHNLFKTKHLSESQRIKHFYEEYPEFIPA